MNVAVIGASNKPDRYSYKAVKLLLEKGHTVFPVHKRINDIDGLNVYKTLPEIADPIDTITLYVAADISTALADDMINIRPKRVILNPGAENPELEQKLDESGILAIRACTLVLLKTDQF